MLSKETQYRLYSGTSKDDFTGWKKAEVDDPDSSTQVWSLELGDGYYLDRAFKTVKGLFGKKTLKVNSVRRDSTIEDPEGDYRDMNFSILFDVRIMISQDTIKFHTKSDSFIVLSREPADWDEFSKDVPKFDEKNSEENWASFYR